MVVAAVMGVFAVANTRAEDAPRAPHTPMTTHTDSEPEPIEGARCCNVDDGACAATSSVCDSEEISVWCDAGELPLMEVHGEWTCV